MVLMTLLISCEKENVSPDNNSGFLELSFKSPTQSLSGSRVSNTAIPPGSMLMISISKADGTPVLTKHKEKLIKFGSEYTTGPLLMHAGDYKLDEFIVLNEKEESILATPKKNASLAYLIKEPLPKLFKIKSGKSLKLAPEVITTYHKSPGEFGYASFSLDEINIFAFLMSTFRYNWHNKSLELTDADITVSSDGKVLFDSTMAAGLDKISLPDGYDQYTVTVHKANYIPYTHNFTADSLKMYFSDDLGPLKILLEDGLILWNKLGSDDEVLHSEVGPNLSFGMGIQQYVEGKFGNAVTIKPGTYYVTQRLRNVIFNNTDLYLNTEAGTIECYFKANVLPKAYSNNPYRIFNGSYGLDAGINLQYHDYNDGKSPRINFIIRFGGTMEILEFNDFESDGYLGKWVHLAAVWDRNGIEGSDQTMRIYIDGMLKASSTSHNWGNTVGHAADIASGNDQNIAEKFFVDNLKIYSLAKTDFSDIDLE